MAQIRFSLIKKIKIGRPEHSLTPQTSAMKRFCENCYRLRTVNRHRELTGSLKRHLEKLENVQKVTIQRERSLLNTGQLCKGSRKEYYVLRKRLEK